MPYCGGWFWGGLGYDVRSAVRANRRSSVPKAEVTRRRTRNKAARKRRKGGRR